MLEKTYNSMNEQISVDPGLISNTLMSVQNTKKQKTGKTKPLYRRPIVIAVAFALCLVLAAPVMASNVPAIYQLMYLVSPEAAQFFVPVQKACQDNGIRMEVVTANIHDSTAEIYITLQDLTGDRVDETIDLFDSYSIHRAFSSSASCKRIGYDADTKTATFLILITEWGNHNITGSKLTFSVREFISDKTALENVRVDIDLTEADEVSETQTVNIIGSGGTIIPENIKSSGRSNVLVPEPSICSPVKGLDVTAMGFVDGKLHIQMATAEKQTLDNHGYFYLIDQVGNRVNYDYSVSFAEGLDSAVRADYQEFVFAVSRDQIENYALYGSFYTSGINTKGNWRITFPLQ